MKEDFVNTHKRIMSALEEMVKKNNGGNSMDNKENNIDVCKAWIGNLLEKLSSETETDINFCHEKIRVLEYQIKEIDDYEERYKEGCGLNVSDLDKLSSVLRQARIDRREKIKIIMKDIINKNILYQNVIHGLLTKINPEKLEKVLIDF